MADTDRGLQPSVSALQRARTVIAAILLMLHWAAPSLRPFDPLPGYDDSAPAYSTALNAFATGTLPRAVARIQSFDLGMAKPGRPLWQGGGATASLPPGRFDPGASLQAAWQDAAASSPQALPPHEFQARAPPMV